MLWDYPLGKQLITAQVKYSIDAKRAPIDLSVVHSRLPTALGLPPISYAVPHGLCQVTVRRFSSNYQIQRVSPLHKSDRTAQVSCPRRTAPTPLIGCLSKLTYGAGSKRCSRCADSKSFRAESQRNRQRYANPRQTENQIRSRFTRFSVPYKVQVVIHRAGQIGFFLTRT